MSSTIIHILRGAFISDSLVVESCRVGLRLLLGLSLTLRALDAWDGWISRRLRLLGAEDRWCSWVLLRGWPGAAEASVPT